MSEYLLVLNAVYTTLIGILLKIEHEQHKTQIQLAKIECEKRMREECEEEMNWKLAQMRNWINAELERKEKESGEKEKRYWAEIDPDKKD